MINFLRANLINLPREALKDLDTAIIDAGVLVYSLYDSVEGNEDMAVGDLNQVIAKAYEVYHLVVGCINNDIPEWCLVRWIGDIIEEITLLMREVMKIHEKKVADLVLHTTTDVAGAHTSQFARISIREEMVGFDEVLKTLRQKLIGGSSELDVISIR
ncbi:hypothetical protein HAX54_033317 [Datura stramonium]|uniref:Late blight resistance protein R1A-like N-terminal domain-containing protein n=1 Tax=Datura stramonium TaxID=4076 RepID=A0ABS8SE46_DATST|nr:hypothetical protein [Datura stramonium]